MLEIEKVKFIKCVLWWCVLISLSCELPPACDMQYFLVARKWNDLEQSTMAYKCGNTIMKVITLSRQKQCMTNGKTKNYKIIN